MDRVLTLIGVVLAVLGAGLGYSSDARVNGFGAKIIATIGAIVIVLGVRKMIVPAKLLEKMHFE